MSPSASPPRAPAAPAARPVAASSHQVVRRITPHDHAVGLPHPGRFFRDLVRHHHLVTQLTWRDALGRYRGSSLGVLWSFLNPLLLLAIFTVVFKAIFRGKFTGHANETEADFALQLFAGLIVFNLFAECIGRAPSLILLNLNYVKKIVFPLEMLPVTLVFSALFHLLVSLLPLTAAVLAVHHQIAWSAWQWALLLLPIVLLGLGVSWLMSALGVFFRDLGQMTLALTNILMYASAVFYPLAYLDRVPEQYRSVVQFLVHLNPVAFLCEQSRNVFVWGEPLDWPGYGWIVLSSALVAALGYVVFMGVKHAFADVL